MQKFPVRGAGSSKALCVAFAAAVLGLVPPASAFGATTTIPAGALLHGTFQSSLNTKTAYAGQPFSILIVPPYPIGGSALHGAVVRGHVYSVQRAGRGTNAELKLEVDKLTTAAGSSKPISASITGSNAPPPAKKPGRVLAATLGGMALGNWAGKATFGGKAGGTVGAVSGYLVSSNVRQDLTVPAGTAVAMQLASPVALK
jgi:hypothetical protein